MKLERTPMMTGYLVKLAVRIGIFLAVLAAYLSDKSRLYGAMTQPLWMGVTPVHILWLVFMVMMVRHLIPARWRSMALLKAQQKEYIEESGYSELELLRYVQNMNVRAWFVMLVWLLANCLFGLLYVFGCIQDVDLLMLTVFYFLCDYICILFFCPFQTFIMKNRCCVNCRIYDWGHFMMFTPMLFIRNFFSWSLFAMSCIVLIRWEVVYAQHPERFWSGSNRTLQCHNCKDKTCQMKRGLAAYIQRKTDR